MEGLRCRWALASSTFALQRNVWSAARPSAKRIDVAGCSWDMFRSVEYVCFTALACPCHRSTACWFPAWLAKKPERHLQRFCFVQLWATTWGLLLCSHPWGTRKSGRPHVLWWMAWDPRTTTSTPSLGLLADLIALPQSNCASPIAVSKNQGGFNVRSCYMHVILDLR